MKNQKINNLDELNKFLKTNQTISLVSFYSPICDPCLMLKPVLNEISQMNKINLFWINALECPEIVSAFNVSQWPTTLIYDQEKLVENVLGYQPLVKWQSLLANLKN